MVRACFSQRRKTLLNNLLPFVGETKKERLAELFAAVGIQPHIRAESLTIEQFAQLANALLPLGQ